MWKSTAAQLFRSATRLKNNNQKFALRRHISSQCEGLKVENRDNVLWVKFDRPAKFNAFTREMYIAMTSIFNEANNDKTVRAVVLTGSGEYYSSGNDLTNFLKAMQDEQGPKAGLTKSKEILLKFVDSLIDLDKLLIAAVNGPAVGIPVTTLPLCDHVIASDKATFQSPFTALGQCPEACSSFTFPRLMGPSRATELLLLNMSWTAEKAKSYGLVSEVIEHSVFYTYLEKLLKGIVQSTYPVSMMESKKLIKDLALKEKLRQVNKHECDIILERWLSDECNDAVQKFFNRSKK